MSIQLISNSKHVPVQFNDDVNHIGRFGLVFLLCTVVLGGVWAFFAPIDEAAVASGVVSVKSKRKSLQHLDGGTVNTLSVKEGQFVKKGDLLLTLDGTQNKSQLEITKGQFISLTAQVARLEAEKSFRPSIVFPNSLNSFKDARVNEVKLSETTIFNSRRNAHHIEKAILIQRINQLRSKIEGLKEQKINKTKLAESYSEETKDLNELVSEGFADIQRSRETSRSHTITSGEIYSLDSEISSSRIAVDEARLQIVQIDKRYIEEVATKLNEAKMQLNDVSQRLVAMKDKYFKVDLRSPVSGRVINLKAHTIGGVVLPGQTILEIVPENEDLIIDAKIFPTDIDKVMVGLQAKVRFSAYNQVNIPEVSGKVINISPDSIVDEQTGTAYYSAQIELPSSSLEKISSIELIPGMPVEVLIKVGERTFFQYLSKPITNVFAKSFIEE